jgi:hypothetical protein
MQVLTQQYALKMVGEHKKIRNVLLIFMRNVVFMVNQMDI